MAITAKNFKTKLNGFVKSATTQRDNLQELVIFALGHAKDNADEFTLLTNIMQATVEIKSIRTEVLKDFIKEHVSNMVFAKNKAGEYMFKKDVKGTACEYSVINTNWYDFNKKGNNPAVEIDVMKRAESLIKALADSLEGKGKKRIKNGQEEKAVELIKALQALV